MHPENAADRRDRKSLNVLARRAAAATGGALAVVLLAVILWKGIDVFLVVFGGILLGVVLHAAAGAVARRTPLGRGVALTLVVLLLVGLAVLAGWLIAPRIGEQMSQLSDQFPAALDQLQSSVEQTRWGSWLLSRQPSPGEILEPQRWSSLVGRMAGAFTLTFSAIAGVLIILFTGLYLAAQPKIYRKGFLHLLPKRHRPRAREVLDKLGETLTWWFLGQLASMTVIGVLTAIGLWALGIPLALTLALLAALLTFIPNFGPVASAIPPVLLALVQDGPQLALQVILLYVGVQTLESYLITPLIQRRAVFIPPALLLVAQVLLTVLFGFLALVLAVPLTAAALVLVQMLWVQDALGDEVELPSH